MMALDFFHPSSARLRTFLETGETDKVALHVEHCERCADRLVDLDEELEAERDEAGAGADVRDQIVEALNSVYTAPDDLNDRLVAHVERRSKNERELALLAGLMKLGVDTARLMAHADDDGAGRRYGPEGVEGSAAQVSHRKEHG